jgi:hypothetical protein
MQCPPLIVLRISVPPTLKDLIPNNKEKVEAGAPRRANHLLAVLAASHLQL